MYSFGAGLSSSLRSTVYPGKTPSINLTSLCFEKIADWDLILINDFLPICSKIAGWLGLISSIETSGKFSAIRLKLTFLSIS
jgi:hypothetical protein